MALRPKDPDETMDKDSFTREWYVSFFIAFGSTSNPKS